MASRVSPSLKLSGKLPKSSMFILHVFLHSNEDELENNVDMFRRGFGWEKGRKKSKF